MVRKQEKEVLVKLVRMYRDRPCLWDTSLKSYLSRQLREEAYAEMLPVYQIIDEDATLSHLKKKILNMRYKSTSEARKVKYAKKKGQVYVPHLWYYKEFAFLNKLLDHEIDKDEDSDKNESESEEMGSVNDETMEILDTTNSGIFLDLYTENKSFSSSTPAHSSSKESRSQKYNPNKRPRECTESSDINNIWYLEREACESFGRSVGAQLSKMYVENALLAQSRIQTILTEIGISDHRQKVAEQQIRFED